MQGNPVKEWPERNHDEQQKRKTGQGTECCWTPTADEATASTIVSASTASTSELTNAVVTAGAAVVQIIYSSA